MPLRFLAELEAVPVVVEHFYSRGLRAFLLFVFEQLVRQPSLFCSQEEVEALFMVEEPEQFLM
jgi:hypothetical protein